MQWLRAWVLDLSWNSECPQVPGASFLPISFLFWNEDTCIYFTELFYELHEIYKVLYAETSSY